MGCGCGKGMKNVAKNTQGGSPRSQQIRSTPANRTVASQISPISAQALPPQQQPLSATPPNQAGMDEERRRIERIRREAIRKALNH